MIENQLILGNSLDILNNLPSNIVDCGVTSPPYNKQEKNKGWLVKNVVYDNASDKKTEAEYQQEQISLLNQLYRITKSGGSFFYNHKTRWEKGNMIHPLDWIRKTDWVIRQEIIWDRVIAANIRGWRFWQIDERIYWLYKPIDNNNIGEELQSKYAKLTSVWRNIPEGKNPHPAPFPLWLPTRVISAICGDNRDNKKAKKLIIDPYVGSGTTAVASKILGHNYIGVDCSSHYLQYAEDRIANADNLESDIIKKELDLHFVKETFAEKKQKNKNVGKFRNKELQNFKDANKKDFSQTDMF